MTTFALELDNITKDFGGVHALKGVSLALKAGEIHALLGENGAGKSTLMSVAAGDIEPDEGTIRLADQAYGRLTPQKAQALGIALVHQHPALIPDLTVRENLLLAVPRVLRDGIAEAQWVQLQLDGVRCSVNPDMRLAEVDVAQRQQVELAKGLAIGPQILILDEPTAALTPDLIDVLFEKIRAAAAAGTAVVYISHRLQEIRQIAHRVTVMRDGRVQRVDDVVNLSDGEILSLIVGRETTQVYPDKRGAAEAGGLKVEHFSGRSFRDVSIDVRPGEIVGLAGINGNGQAGFLRALAGLAPSAGAINLNDNRLTVRSPTEARKAKIAFMSSDRSGEGLVLRMSVRENAALSALAQFASFGVLSASREQRAVAASRASLAIKTPELECPVSSLSGGNQQKVVLARALLSDPAVLLAEEPTAGVDIGARAEIYRILRDVAERGIAVLVLSSDTTELEGLCDRVYVFSRGRVVGELRGSDVTEEQIGHLMILAPNVGTENPAASDVGIQRERPLLRRLAQFASGDFVPSLVLALLVVTIGAFATAHNLRFISAYNVERMLLLASALALIGFGQLCVVLTGGLDLSVGPLVGLVVVVGSFFFAESYGPQTVMMGFAAIVLVGALVGVTNGMIVRFGRCTPVAATLGTYLLVQGCSVLLRPYPGGSIGGNLSTFVQQSWFGVPLVFMITIAMVVGLEWALRCSRWGLKLRAAGSDETSASKIGVETDRTIIGAYVLSSLFTVAGGVIVAMQLGIGDPNQGKEYTLGSIAAVALGGASLFGGRGSFIPVLFGALLIVMTNNVMSFFALPGSWQYWFTGGLTLAAVVAYSKAGQLLRAR